MNRIQDVQNRSQFDITHDDHHIQTSNKYTYSFSSSLKERNLSERMEQINSTCHNSSVWSEIKDRQPHGTVWKYNQMYYCEVPKVGCTYWKRVLLYLSHSYQQSNVHQPSDLDKIYVHFAKHYNLGKFNMDEEIMDKTIDTSFMFTRDPYARLWSAYIDKFFLPDFWGQHGTNYGTLAGVNVPEKDFRCFKDISFVDFLTAITKIWPGRLDHHWEPIYLLCGPCHINYAVIGKMETFLEDVEYIKRKFGLNWNETTERGDLEEVYTITKYNFQLENKTKCFNKTEVAERLWKAFQYNGYINKLCDFPVTEFKHFNVTLKPSDMFMDIVRALNCYSNFDRKLQRRFMMIEAYKEVPNTVFNKIKHIYKYDFEIFGYDIDLLL
ncbi:hypothetical protein ACF0H5_008955 [Mactra antiquata]